MPEPLDYTKKKKLMAEYNTETKIVIKSSSKSYYEGRNLAEEYFKEFKKCHAAIKIAQDDSADYMEKYRKIAEKIAPLQAKLKKAEKAGSKDQIEELEPQIEKLHRQAETLRGHVEDAIQAFIDAVKTIERAEAVAKIR